MDQNLTNLRRQALKTSTAFLRAQHVYSNAADIGAIKSETELKEAAEEYRKAIEPYDAALQELRQHLLAAEPSFRICQRKSSALPHVLAISSSRSGTPLCQSSGVKGWKGFSHNFFLRVAKYLLRPRVPTENAPLEVNSDYRVIGHTLQHLAEELVINRFWRILLLPSRAFVHRRCPPGAYFDL